MSEVVKEKWTGRVFTPFWSNNNFKCSLIPVELCRVHRPSTAGSRENRLNLGKIISHVTWERKRERARDGSWWMDDTSSCVRAPNTADGGCGWWFILHLKLNLMIVELLMKLQDLNCVFIKAQNWLTVSWRLDWRTSRIKVKVVILLVNTAVCWFATVNLWNRDKYRKATTRYL